VTRCFKLLLMVITWSSMGASMAETITLPIGAQGASSMAIPTNGMSRQAVLERYGLADDEHEPVGKPPIQRWDYREFSVYFENDRVVNSVRHHQPRMQKEE
jgi:hypothetical protein